MENIDEFELRRFLKTMRCIATYIERIEEIEEMVRNTQGPEAIAKLKQRSAPVLKAKPMIKRMLLFTEQKFTEKGWRLPRWERPSWIMKEPRPDDESWK